MSEIPPPQPVHAVPTAVAPKPYETLLHGYRLRKSKVEGRELQDEADADRGRTLFCAPFRRLQNKAQVFSLETNAAVRSRLTHSLEVSSIGRFVASQAIAAFDPTELAMLGIAGRERPLITFVETACLLHDLGNPPFGHFGEIAISDWFHVTRDALAPRGIAGDTRMLWQRYYADFEYFDGNPQGFRLVTRLQASETGDLFGLNLTGTTLAATVKYPWSAWELRSGGEKKRKKPGYFKTEEDVVAGLWAVLGLKPGVRHPLAYLMEAADDIAYCVSDIEDGLEKGLINGAAFADRMIDVLKEIDPEQEGDAFKKKAVADMLKALALLKEPCFSRDDQIAVVERLTPMQDFRSGVIRFLAYQAGQTFRRLHPEILAGSAPALLHAGSPTPLLQALNGFAATVLYSSRVVRQRELTAHAVLCGILDSYKPLIDSDCDRNRFERALKGDLRDDNGRPITRESSLAARIPRKYLAVYREEVRLSDKHSTEEGVKNVMERIYRIRLIVDYISGMTDEFALQTHQLISGMQINPHRD